MQKIKLLFLTLFAFIGLNASAQLTSQFYVTVTDYTGFCQHTVYGNYYDSQGVFVPITFTQDPSQAGFWIGTIPFQATDTILNINICATYTSPGCNGEACLYYTPLSIGPGQGVMNFDITLIPDSDGDGVTDDLDCQPLDYTIYPGASENCGNGIDDNCDGAIEIIPTIDTLYFVPDSLAPDPFTIYVVCQTTNATEWDWGFGNGTGSFEQYPTTITFPTWTWTSENIPIQLSAGSSDGCEAFSGISFIIDSTGVWSPAGIMTEYTLNVVPEFIIGVEENVSQRINTWPNPTSENLNITVSEAYIGETYSLYNNMGQLILTNKIQSTQTTLDVSNLSKGAYTLAIKGARKLVVVE
jgi:hypothetical protein